MKPLTTIMALMAASPLTSALTPEGFSPSAEDDLIVMFGDKLVTPGMALTAEETATLPTILSSTPLNSTSTYLLLILDITVPANFPPGDPETRRTMLHGMISGYTITDPSEDEEYYPLTTTDPTKPAPYMGPAPPAEDPPKAHQYVELLFETEEEDWTPPGGEDVDWEGFENRIPFDLEGFIEEAGLGDPVLGCWWEVTGEA